MHASLPRRDVKAFLLFRSVLGLIVLGLATSTGLCDSGIIVGRSGPVTAFRVNACLGWAIKLTNDSGTPYTAIYAVNDWAGLKVVPPHSTVKAAYVLGREIPGFRFAPEN
ncbi:MAG: hypothetical protein JO298_07020 [Verrucomicrobia bacterium]|nr:hypothetical protein [Verrucomicrobiota bacterium]MBV9642495.1 hypothetical protein [Verrucomicrobiota bacterium]